MPTMRVVSIVVLICFTPQFAFADRIVLRDGTEIVGTVANREDVAENAAGQEVISILAEDDLGDTDLQRYLVGEIDYIVLEDGESELVVDIIGLEQNRGQEREVAVAPVTTYEPSWEANKRKASTGAGLMVIGAGAVAVGALVKFGDEKVTVTTSSINYDEKSYSELNYALMIGGGVMFLAGVVVYADAKSASRNMFTIDWKPGGSTYLGIACRF